MLVGGGSCVCGGRCSLELLSVFRQATQSLPYLKHGGIRVRREEQQTTYTVRPMLPCPAARTLEKAMAILERISSENLATHSALSRGRVTWRAAIAGYPQHGLFAKGEGPTHCGPSCAKGHPKTKDGGGRICCGRGSSAKTTYPESKCRVRGLGHATRFCAHPPGSDPRSVLWSNF